MYSDTFERWLDTYRINTASYFFTSFAFLPLLAAAKTVGNAPEPGNILNISVSRRWGALRLGRDDIQADLSLRCRLVDVWNHQDLATWSIQLQRRKVSRIPPHALPIPFDLTLYSAYRAATISLSHQLATEFARRDLGVRVNTIAPGYFPSGMTDTSPSDAGGKDAFKKDWGIPLGRPGNAQDYAQCVISTITVSWNGQARMKQIDRLTSSLFVLFRTIT